MLKPFLLTTALAILSSKPFVNAYAPCASGQDEMSVEGIEGIFCVTGPICMDETNTGACPTVQEGLPYGSYCGLVRTGVYGCKVLTADMIPTSALTTAAPVPTTAAPVPTTAAPVPTTATPAFTTPAPTAAAVSTTTIVGTCPSGSNPISVEGVPGIFCAQEPVCMGTTTNTGSCPVPQSGLPDGSYCGTVASGVFGCKVGKATTTTTSILTTMTAAPMAQAPAATTQAPVATTQAPATVTTAPASTSAAVIPTISSNGKCPSGSSPISVEDINGNFCAQEPICTGTTTNTGSCPAAQTGLPSGSYCGKVASGVFGCKPGSAPMGSAATDVPKAPLAVPASQCPAGNSPVTIEGALGVFCVAEPVCAGTTTNTGMCPGVRDGLPTGSHCGVVASGVFGCKVGSASAADTAISAVPVLATQCATGYSPVSVEGALGVFCVAEPVCSGLTTDSGSCPAQHDKLPTGSYCTVVSSGAYGCKIRSGTATSTITTATTTPASTSAATTTTTPSTTTAPVATITAPTTTSAPSTSTPTTTTTTTTTSGSATCAAGSSPISVEGASGVYCVKEPVCAGTTTDTGACPGVLEGLASGSYCTRVSSSVFGCKVGSASTTTSTTVVTTTTTAPATSAPTSAPTTAAPVTIAPTSAPTSAAVVTGNGCAAGSSPISVEGALGVFCVPEPICAGTTTNTGACPGTQDALPTGSYCTIVSTGMYGCKVNGSTAASTMAATLAPTVAPTSAPTLATTNVTATAAPGSCPSGYSPISVQGRARIFCAPEPICMGATTNTGACPGAQDDLEFGSYCTMIKTGVFGCHPYDY